MSQHFSLEEIVFSERASRLGIDNEPRVSERLAIELHLMPGLEKVRALMGGRPMRISSGFRSRALNAETPGSSDTSAHTLGYAADFTCQGFGSPWEVAQAIAASDIAFDQLIYEYAAWVHISFGPRYRRLLTTKLSGQPYRSGLYLT